MPILNHNRPTNRPAVAGVSAAPINRAWPISIVMVAVVMFIVFFAQTTLLLALTMAVATLAAGAMLLTLVHGTGWITQLRGLIRR